MNIKVCEKEYNIESKVDNLLSILFEIKETQNGSLAFRSGCRSEVCGSCAVRVNGVERLACKTKIKDGDIVEPLKNSEVIKDLVVDLDVQDNFLKKSKSYLKTKSNEEITKSDEKKIDIESNCILCNSCFSSCPVYEVNEEFIGPFALVRNYRYIADKKEFDIKEKIDSIQENGVWSCTLCGTCNMVCPAKIDIKNNIMQLRNKSVQNGYSDPNMSNFDSGFDLGGNDFLGNQDFQGSGDFGFNPNGF
jgi:fumarate reductase iron-sulfur subunit